MISLLALYMYCELDLIGDPTPENLQKILDAYHKLTPEQVRAYLLDEYSELTPDDLTDLRDYADQAKADQERMCQLIKDAK